MCFFFSCRLPASKARGGQTPLGRANEGERNHEQKKERGLCDRRVARGLLSDCISFRFLSGRSVILGRVVIKKQPRLNVKDSRLVAAAVAAAANVLARFFPGSSAHRRRCSQHAGDIVFFLFD